MLDAAIWTAIKDQRTRLEKLRDDVDSNGYLVATGLCAVKTRDDYEAFLAAWKHPSCEINFAVACQFSCGAGSFQSELANVEARKMWDFPPGAITHEGEEWTYIFSRTHTVHIYTDDRTQLVNNELAINHYRSIRVKLTALLKRLNYESSFGKVSHWDALLFDLGFTDRLLGITLGRILFPGAAEAKASKGCFYSIIGNAVDASVDAIDWLIDNFEPRITLPRPSFQRNTSANLKEKRPIEVDGPTADYGFRWKGIRVDLPPRPWRLLKCMWGFESRPVGDVMSIVVDDENADWTDDAVKNALHLASDALVKAQYPKTLGRKKTDIIWK